MTNLVHLVPRDTAEDLTDEDVLTAPSRRVAWRYELIDGRGRARRLEGIEFCSVEQNVHAVIRGGGSLRYRGPDIDWHRNRVRIYYAASYHGRTVEWCLGTFCARAPKTTITGDSLEAVDVELYDALSLVDARLSTANPYFFSAGATIQRVREFCERYRIPAVFEDSPEALRSQLAWPPGTSYLRILNDALDALGFFAAAPDPMGVLRSEPYRPPSSRGVERVFEEGPDSILDPVVSRERDDYDVPNQFVAVSAVEREDEKPLVSVATDLTSDYSMSATGRRNAVMEEGVEAASKAILDAYASRRLAELQRVQTTYEVAVLPVSLALNDVVRLRRKEVDALCVVEKFSLSSDSPWMTMTLREVVER